jgi:hypothetical protein
MDENDEAIFGGSATAPQLVARTGEQAPGMPDGVRYDSFSTFLSSFPVLNNAGQVAYRAGLTGTGVTFGNDNAIYAGTFAAPQLVARAGEPAPGAPTNVSYVFFYDPVLNDVGQVAYLAVLNVNGVASGREAAIYTGTPAAPQLVARTGAPAPGMPDGVLYESLFPSTASPVVTPALNDAGHVAYTALLGGTGVATHNDDVLFAGPPDSPHLIVRAGDPAPGTPAGVTYSSFDSTLALNEAGQLVYRARLTGSGVSFANDLGLFAYDPNLGSVLVARTGQLFDVGGGDLRVIDVNGIGFVAGQGVDTQTGLSDDGQLAFSLVFKDGSGVFITSVPEPSWGTLLALSASSLWGCGRRRRRR